MLHLVKKSIPSSAAVTAEVYNALKENTLVVVEKRNIGAQPDTRQTALVVYDIYACQGKVEDSVIVEHQK